jgi:hypothetical protein
MDVLQRNQRPLVQFDPANVEHRRLYRQFLKTGTWSKSPVQFTLHEDFLELPHYLNTLMIQWYMDRDMKLKKSV